MKLSKLDIVGILFVLVGLSGSPWYNIRIEVSRGLWYIFSYSPFRLIIQMGDVIDSNYFYRIDTTILGLMLIFILILRIFKADLISIKYLTPIGMGLLIIFFISFLPIHVTTASRLNLGIGAYAIIIGSTIFFISPFSANLVSSFNLLIARMRKFYYHSE